MQHKLLVGGLHGFGHTQEDGKPCGRVERFFIAVSVDGPARNVLQHQERAACRGHTAIEQPCDAGMRKTGENLALRAKAARHLRTVDTFPQHLECDLLLVGAIGTLGQVDRAHATAPHLPQHTVVSLGAANQRLLSFETGDCLLARCCHREHAARVRLKPQQLLGLGAQRRIACGPLHKCQPLRLW